ncbi:response regulator transcription factor [Miltoncostaea oceani]|uniref:response regulator transcription factor n=1 Tax=Miltoncostaea oceani TaxID=2843216 RepID=UPI001C3D7D89|nr:response regulator transcription factor [Miltoncostaea oceani]
MKVLVVEDEARIASFLIRGLRAQGYAVDHVATGEEALRGARDPELDLMILDLGLPDMDGTEVLRRLRDGGSRLPIVVLTARGDVTDRVEGLDLGADDYLTKPFAFDELLARIRARIRDQDGGPVTVLSVGDVELDIPTRRVRVGDVRHDLTAREFSLLQVFLRRPGQVLSREQILSQVWELDWDPGSNVVDVYVGYLRKKVGDDRIETVRGVGYRFVGD